MTKHEIRQICQKNKELNKTRARHEKLPTTPNSVRRFLNAESAETRQQFSTIFSGKDKGSNSTGV